MPPRGILCEALRASRPRGAEHQPREGEQREPAREPVQRTGDAVARRLRHAGSSPAPQRDKKGRETSVTTTTADAKPARAHFEQLERESAHSP